MTIGEILWRGLIIGFSIAAPVGPIGLLCIRRTLAHGWPTGLLSGLGAASADAVYGGVAAFGLTIISRFLVGQQQLLRLVGGLFLCYLGIKTMLSKPTSEPVAARPGSLLAAYASTFALTLTNPITILSFAAVFASLGPLGGEPAPAVTLLLSVFGGSALWWLTLTGGVGLVRHRVLTHHLLWVNRVSGVIILGFGLFTLISSLVS